MKIVPLKLRIEKEFALKHAKFGVIYEINRDKIYTKENCSQFTEWNIAKEANLSTKTKMEEFAFKDKKITGHPAMFIDYGNVRFVYPLTKTSKESIKELNLGKESGVGIELMGLENIQYHGESAVQSIVLNCMVYQKDACKIAEFTSQSSDNLLKLKEKIISSINSSEASPFIAIMSEGRKYLTKMAEEGHILAEDWVALEKDTKAWLSGKYKQGAYAQNRTEIADRLKDIAIRNKAERVGNIKEEIQNNTNMEKNKNDSNFHKARDFYENLKRTL
jgi:hypothetical protein